MIKENKRFVSVETGNCLALALKQSIRLKIQQYFTLSIVINDMVISCGMGNRSGLGQAPDQTARSSPNY